MKIVIKNITSILIIVTWGLFHAYSQEYEEPVAPEKMDLGTVDLGFGIIQNRNISTASTAAIGYEALEQRAAINLNDALYGRLLGLTALKSSGSQGGWVGGTYFGANYNIRGIQTLTGENNIIVIVDGFERDIDRISIDEIESVTVLKDAAALALWGYRGVNGAIFVKTKRGLTAGSGLLIKANYHHKFTFDANMPEYADAYTYAMAMNESRSNDGYSPTYNQYELNAFRNGLNPYQYANVNWKKETLRDVASEDVFTLTASNRTEKLSFLSLLSYTNSKGLLKDTENNIDAEGYSTQLKYSKANVRTNVDVDLTSSTKFSASVLGIIYETNRPSGIDANQLFQHLYYLPAGAFPVKTEDGLWGQSNTFNFLEFYNPVARIQETGYYREVGLTVNTDFSLTQSFDELVEGLSVTGKFGYDAYNIAFEDRSRQYSWASERFRFDADGQPLILGTGLYDIIREESYVTNTQLSFNRENTSTRRSLNFIMSADYKRQFDAHNVGASLIYHYNNSVRNDRYNTFYRQTVMGYLHYDLSNKYVADVVLSYAGSSRSYPQVWAFSPTVSLGWVLSEEGFLKENKFVSFMKLRGSYGMLHSDNVPRNGTISMRIYDWAGGTFPLVSATGSFSQTGGFRMSTLPTIDFKLETAHRYNAGLDVLLLNSIGVTFDAYYQRRSNILQYASGLYSSLAGIGAGYVNSGIVDSKGIEAGVNYNNQFGDLIVNFGGMITYSINKVIDCVEEPKAYEWLEIKGKPVDQPRGLEHIGFFNDLNDIANSPFQEFSLVRPGDVKYRVKKGDQTVNVFDYVPIGYSTEIPQINYAFNVGLEYKGFGANILFQGAQRYNRWDDNRWDDQRRDDQSLLLLPLVQGRNITNEYYENRWTSGVDNSNARYPALSSSANVNNEQPSTLWLKDASFLKLRNCEVYYRLSESMLSKINYISGLKLSVRGENLYTWTPYNGADPERLGWSYPTLKGFSVGLSVTF